MARRSKAQQEQARAHIARVNANRAGNKENTPSTDLGDDLSAVSRSSLASRASHVSDSVRRIVDARVADLKNTIHNVRRQCRRAKTAASGLRAKAKSAAAEAEDARADAARKDRLIDSLRRDKHALYVRNQRASQKLDAAVDDAQSFSLKDKGVFTPRVREMTRNLTAICKVPIANVGAVIETCAKGFGKTLIGGSMDKHSASRITLEGYVASDMQLVQEIHEAGGKQKISCVQLVLIKLFQHGLVAAMALQTNISTLNQKLDYSMYLPIPLITPTTILQLDHWVPSRCSASLVSIMLLTIKARPS